MNILDNEVLFTRLSAENEDNYDSILTNKLTNLKGRDILKEYPKYRDYLKRKFVTENENHNDINEMINNINFFEYINMVKTLDIEEEKKDYIINQSLFYISQVFDDKFDDNEVRMKRDTQQIFDYEVKTEKLKRFFEFLKTMESDEIFNSFNNKNNNNLVKTSTFQLYYQMKKTFIFMKELKNMEEEEYLNYLNSKLGFSIENFMKIKNFIISPNRNDLNKNDKQDILGFYSTYGIIPRNFKNSRNYQNQVFQQIDENNKKKKIFERMNRKLEEKKRVKIENENIIEETDLNKSVLEIDKELNNLNININNIENIVNNLEKDNMENEDENNNNDNLKKNKNKNSKKKNSKNKKRKNNRK